MLTKLLKPAHLVPLNVNYAIFNHVICVKKDIIKVTMNVSLTVLLQPTTINITELALPVTILALLVMIDLTSLVSLVNLEPTF
jgi:hypothetical protein